MGIAIANRKNRCDFGALRHNEALNQILESPGLEGLTKKSAANTAG